MRNRNSALSAEARARAIKAARSISEAPPAVTSTKRSPAFEQLDGYKERQILRDIARMQGLDVPTFRQQESRPGPISVMDGKEVLNFGSYDYVGLNLDPRPGAAAKAAIERYGVSASGSRFTAGERPIHRTLETRLAEHYDVDDALCFVSGHATNVSAIATLTGKHDLILYDAYIHNSAAVGAELSAASRRSFPHNDMDALERMLQENANRYRATLVVVEGHYSMDGDIPDLGRLMELKRTFGFWLMVDEAHGLGCIGATGKGVREVYSVAGRDVDVWMGTLSKSLGSTGGYIAGSKTLIEIMKYEAPGSVYSVAVAPPLAAAAACSLKILCEEPERVQRLQENGAYFLARAKAVGLDTGDSIGSSIIPVIVRDPAIAIALSNKLLEHGVNALPAVFPGVPLNAARVRFFVTSEHSKAQIDTAVTKTARLLQELGSSPIAHLIETITEKTAQ